jgi:phytoene/squalene synthetase
VYLPLEDLHRFRVLEEELAGPRSDRLTALCRFEAARAAALLERGLPLAGTLGGRIGRSVALFARGGLAALAALERSGWDVFSSRPAPGRLTFALLTARELLRR